MAMSASRARKVLLVDDCVTQRDLYQVILERDFRVVTAARGAEGLALAIAERPDLIVLDVMMPGLDGWETCTRIKSHPVTAEIPVVLLTAADDRDLSQHAAAVGAAAILTKPCHADGFLEQLFAVLDPSERKGGSVPLDQNPLT